MIATFCSVELLMLFAQVKEAIQQHFDFATPAVAPMADEPSTPRLLKRLKMADCETEASHAAPPRFAPLK